MISLIMCKILYILIFNVVYNYNLISEYSLINNNFNLKHRYKNTMNIILLLISRVYEELLPLSCISF